MTSTHKRRRIRRSSHIDSVYRSSCLRSADDVTIDWWWRHNYLTNCDESHANTWNVTFNSLHIDFIHGYIHDRSCENIFPKCLKWTLDPWGDTWRVVPNLKADYYSILILSSRLKYPVIPSPTPLPSPPLVHNYEKISEFPMNLIIFAHRPTQNDNSVAR